MKLFGLKTNELHLIKEILAKHFANVPSLKVYIFGSRARGDHSKYSDIDLTIKSRRTISSAEVSSFKEELENSDLAYKVDIVLWQNIVPAYLKQIQKQKVPFWTPNEIEKFTPWRICPIGQHWVTKHDRKLKTGTIFDREGHCRKNPSHKDVLKADEIDAISGQPIFQNVPIKASMNDMGHRVEGNRYNDLISGWVAYWNDVFSPKTPLHPDDLKALVKTESGFNLTAEATPRLNVGKARGLVQLTEQTIRILKNVKGELKDNFVDLAKEDILVPSKNICASVRWLFRKKEILEKRLKREASWEEVFWEYKGIYGQKNKEAIKIKNSLHDALVMLGRA